MDEELKICLGKLLGEVYSIKNTLAELRGERNLYDEHVIDGLLSKNEFIIDREFGLEESFILSSKTYNDILEDLNTLTTDEIANLDGFYTIPKRIASKYSRVEWIVALRIMINESIFVEIIEKIRMGQNSPVEINNLFK